MKLPPNTVSCTMRRTKEEDDSRFRSTNTAQCAEKGESSSSFALYIEQEITFGDSLLM